jgi:Fe-S oxidoreductase
VKLGQRFGINFHIVPSGCCGMAGLYGHERSNRATSEAIYESSWRPILANPKNAGRALATGYSCRCQASLMDGLALPHPLQLLLRRVRANGTELPRSVRTGSERRCDDARNPSRCIKGGFNHA